MSEEQSKPQSEINPEQPSFQWIRPDEGIYEVYSDFVHLNWTSLGVRIRFAQIVPDPHQPADKAPWVIEERAAITMPWFQIKILHELFAEIMKKYEAVNGEITLPQMPT